MQSSKAVLLVAHPGHELRLYRWLELARPTVFVLTDGSGGSGHSRVPSTLSLLAKAGARAGAVMGPFTDHEMYNAILACDPGALASVTLELAAAFSDADMVVTDAWEGYNPSHDVCRIVAGLAAEHASIPLYDYAVTERTEMRGGADEIVLRLDDDAAARKLAAAYAYTELRGDVEEMLAHGPEQLRLEVLRPAAPPRTDARPFYETRGEEQVAAGRYQRVLRYREHFAPFVDALTAAVRIAAVAACALSPLA